MKKAGQKIAELSLKSMNLKLSCIWVVLISALPIMVCFGVPAYNYNQNWNAPKKNDENASNPSSSQLKTTLSDLKNEIRNHESELRTFEGQLQNQEAILDHFRQELSESLEIQQRTTTAQTVNLEARLNALDNSLKGLIEDMRQMKNQANDSVTILGQYKLKLGEFENLMEAQNQHMKNLETGLTSIVEVMQAQEASEKMLTNMSQSSSSKVNTYKVQQGDRLEKIARNFNISLQGLREANNLKDDKIFVGQKLKIPN